MITLRALPDKVLGRCRQIASSALFRNPVRMLNDVPIVSFTFDDFPRTAYQIGGTILRDHQVHGTYYAALGLAGTLEPVGEIFSPEDLGTLVADGHELGCHTFAHCHSWNTAPAAFEQSIVENGRRLSEWVPDACFTTFAYPLAGPRPNTKRRAARHFSCCRAGGQSYNAGVVDRGLLSAYFLEQARDPDAVKSIIDRNAEACGWLIFATHDVCDAPSSWGCTPGFFEEVVRYTVRSGATVLRVDEAWDVVRGQAASEFANEHRSDGVSVDDCPAGLE